MNIFMLWENDSFAVSTPKNPHVPYTEGAHLVVVPKREIANAWQDAKLSADTFELAAQTCAMMEQLGFSTWFNIQANGNWGLLPGGTPFFHIHVYGRNKTARWAKPMILPEAPGTYHHEPMAEHDRHVLSDALKRRLG